MEKAESSSHIAVCDTAETGAFPSVRGAFRRTRQDDQHAKTCHEVDERKQAWLGVARSFVENSQKRLAEALELFTAG